MKQILLITALLSLGALSSRAEDRPGPGGGGLPPGGGGPAAEGGKSIGDGALPEFLKPFDTDGDGKLSEQERQAAREALQNNRHDDFVSKWDTDGDGKLSEDELAAAREAMRQHGEDHRGKRFDEADTDDDGFLSKEEFIATPGTSRLPAEVQNSIFDRLDTDDDGKISKEEFLTALRPPQPPRPDPLPAFADVDTDDDNAVTLEELKTALPNVPVERLRNQFAQADHNRDHKLNAEEYSHFGGPPVPPRAP